MDHIYPTSSSTRSSSRTRNSSNRRSVNWKRKNWVFFFIILCNLTTTTVNSSSSSSNDGQQLTISNCDLTGLASFVICPLYILHIDSYLCQFKCYTHNRSIGIIRRRSSSNKSWMNWIKAKTINRLSISFSMRTLYFCSIDSIRLQYHLSSL